MAAIGQYMLKMTAVFGSVPLIGIAVGYKIRFEQAEVASSSRIKRMYRICDLPMYPPENDVNIDVEAPYPCNIVEETIGVVRRAVQNTSGKFMASCSRVTIPIKTSYDASRAYLKTIQFTTGDYYYASIIVGSGIGGCVLGYRSGKKLTFGLLASMCSAVICYPKKIGQLYQSISDVAFLGGDGKLKQAYEIPVLNTSDCCNAENVETILDPEEDIDLSEPENKDLYFMPFFSAVHEF